METRRLDGPLGKNMELRLNNFPLFRALSFDSRKMGALTLPDFANLARGTGLVLTEKEKRGMSRQELDSLVRKCFLYLDANRDGLLSPQDADREGRINDFSRIEAMYERELRKGEPYAGNGKGEPSNMAKAALQFMNKKREGIKGSRQAMAHAGAFVYSYRVPLLYLEQEQEGATILHMSDIHFKKDGKRNGQKIGFISTLKDAIAKPDIMVVTGDFIEKAVEDFVKGAQQALAGLFEGALRFFVLGNHDYKNGAAESVAGAMEEAGYVNITNKHLVADVKGHPFGITGVDDYQEGKPKVPEMPEGSILTPNVLATHNLDAVDGTYPGCFDLVLTGHTHLGEKDFIFFDLEDLMRLFSGARSTNGQKDEWGMASQRTIFHITSGLGSHTTRFNATPEGVSLITLAQG